MSSLLCSSAASLSTRAHFLSAGRKHPSTSRASPLPPLRMKRRIGVARAAGTADENMPRPDSFPGDCSAVDANMTILRRRIEGLRCKETYIHSPEEWMAWERSCYNTYRADINVLVATLQSHLLSTRPSVVVFIVSLLLAVTPVASLLLVSAVGTQLYSINSAVLEHLAGNAAHL